MNKPTIIALASSCALAVAGLGASAAGAAASSATAGCPPYTQLTGGGGSFRFVQVEAIKTSCKVALTVLEVFANNRTERVIEGFVCDRRPYEKIFSARCAHGSATVTFFYRPPSSRPTPGTLLHHSD